MKKLKLDADELRVQTFETVEADHGRGTVYGHYTVETQDPCGTCISQGGGYCDTADGYTCACGPTVDPNNAYCTFENCTTPGYC